MSGFVGAVLIVFAILLIVSVATSQRNNKRAIENMRAIEETRRLNG